MQPCTGKIHGFECKDVFDALSNVTPGTIATLILCIIGFCHNIILLVVAHRIKWFQHCQYFLIVNQTVVDLFTSFIFGFSAIRTLSYSLTQTPDIMTVGNCNLIYLAANILFTCTQRCALIVAFDRLYSVLFPFSWLRRSEYYRYGLISFAWIMAIWPEIAWLFSVSLGFDYAGDQYNLYGVPICMPRCEANIVTGAEILFQIENAFDNAFSILIIVFYIIIPTLSATVCKRVACGQEHVTVYWSGMEQHQRALLNRVKVMSFATVFIYLCTEFTGTFMMDYLPNLFKGGDKYFIYPIATAVSMMNTVPSLYVFAWKDDNVRRELKKIFDFGSCCAKKTIADSENHLENRF